MNVFRALRHTTFLALWLGQTLSRIGDALYQLALAWWVLKTTHSPQAMGTVLILSVAPSIVLALAGGVVADRLPRARIMLASDLARTLVSLGLALLAASGHRELGWIYAASLLFGIVDAFFHPAYAALIPRIVPADDLPSANTLTGLGTSLGRIAGPAIGAGLIAAVGVPGAFAVNALTFAVSSALLVPALRAPREPVAASAPASVADDLRAALVTVRSRSWLWIGLLVFALTNVTLAGPFSIAMPFLVDVFRRAGVGTLAWIYAAFPVGYVLGGLILGRCTVLRRRGPLLYGALGVAGLMLALFGLPLPLWALVLAAVVNGAMLEAGQLAWTSLLQERIPSEQQGRVFSLDNAVSSALLPVGFALVGWLAQAAGPAACFLLGGGATALLAVTALSAAPALRQLD